jgi:hypothetical protein
MVSCSVNPARTAEHKLLRIDDPMRVSGVRRRTGKQQPAPSSGSSLNLVAHVSRGIALQRTASTGARLAIEHFGDWGENAHVSHV